jgi:formate hydrogenlyase subunit 4
MASSILINALQVLFVLGVSPLLRGVLVRIEERFQGKRGPAVWQPYADLYKLWNKASVARDDASWIVRFAPYVYFITPIIVTLLIPALTNFPLFMAFMGDMVAAGFILGLGGFFLALAAIDAGDVYGALGASRTRMVSSLVEPIFVIVFFAVSLTANATIPYVVTAHWVSSANAFFAPSHLLIVAAFFMILLAETGRIPVDNPSGHFELAMIDESKTLDFSGRPLALLKWGGYVKFMVLGLVLTNVLVAPWGLAGSARPVALGEALLAVGGKLLVLTGTVAVIETSLAKLRLYRIPEFLGAAFVTAVLALLVQPFHG